MKWDVTAACKCVLIIQHEDDALAEAEQTQRGQRAGRDSPLTSQWPENRKVCQYTTQKDLYTFSASF